MVTMRCPKCGLSATASTPREAEHLAAIHDREQHGNSSRSRIRTKVRR
jgi:predicted small metal-binding protein